MHHDDDVEDSGGGGGAVRDGCVSVSSTGADGGVCPSSCICLSVCHQRVQDFVSAHPYATAAAVVTTGGVIVLNRMYEGTTTTTTTTTPMVSVRQGWGYAVPRNEQVPRARVRSRIGSIAHDDAGPQVALSSPVKLQRCLVDACQPDPPVSPCLLVDRCRRLPSSTRTRRLLTPRPHPRSTRSSSSSSSRRPCRWCVGRSVCRGSLSLAWSADMPVYVLWCYVDRRRWRC